MTTSLKRFGVRFESRAARCRRSLFETHAAISTNLGPVRGSAERYLANDRNARATAEELGISEAMLYRILRCTVPER